MSGSPYLKFLIGRGRYLRALCDTCRHVIHHRRVPLLPPIPRMVRERFDPDFKKPSFPPWLNPEFESRYGLRARWEEDRAKQVRLSSLHPVRPEAYESFTGSVWQALFESIGFREYARALEARLPFVDLRLLRYMLAVPAIPWCRVKYLECQAMRGILPKPVRRRLKTTLRDDLVWDTLKGSKLPESGMRGENPSVRIASPDSGIGRPGPNIVLQGSSASRIGFLVAK